MFFQIFVVWLALWLQVLFAHEANQGCDDVEQMFLLQVAHRMANTKSVAVFVSGTLQRYQPTSTAAHLVSPMVKQGYKVDYYIHLNASEFQSWHSEADKYMSDPSFSGLDENGVKKAIADPLTYAGATVRSLILASGGPLNMTDEENSFVNGTSMLGRQLWNWYCTKEPPNRAMGARMNYLLRYKGFEKLWTQALAVERATGFPYDYVIVHQDDAAWVHDFDFMAFLNYNGASQSEGARGFSVSCGQGSSYITHPTEYIDSIWILERQAAVPYLTLYQQTIMADDSELFAGRSEPICTSEMLQKLVSDNHNVKMSRVPAATIPMQRVGRIQHAGALVNCYHYICVSEDRRENVFDNMPMCAALE